MVKKVLVTGGTRGIGFATANILREAGYEVIVAGRSLKGKGPNGCAYLPCDFSDTKATEAFSKKLTDLGISILVNNAGINLVKPFVDYDLADFNRLQQVNVTAPFLLCRSVVPGMCRQGFGRIVNITSIFSVVSRPGRSAYAASKFGLLGLSRTLALEVAKDNVLVNCVAPGLIDTEMSHRNLGESGITEMMQKIPMRRMAKPDEIANVIKFLVSGENTYMTGQNIIVDGGFTSA